MTSIGLVCAACGTELPSDSKFCNKCGTPVGVQHSPAEYKQVTVLFADVVHSMDRRREIVLSARLENDGLMRTRRLASHRLRLQVQRHLRLS